MSINLVKSMFLFIFLNGILIGTARSGKTCGRELKLCQKQLAECQGQKQTTTTPQPKPEKVPKSFPIVFTAWRTIGGDPEPNNLGVEHCILIGDSSWQHLWNNMRCDASTGFICEKNEGCKNDPAFDIKSKSGSCYHFSTESDETWFGAQKKCLKMSSHLVAIEQMSEQKYILKTIKKLGLDSSSFWTGGNYLAKQWVWQYRGNPGKQVMRNQTAISGQTFTAWSIGEPNHVDRGSAGVEECIVLDTISPQFWNDIECGRSVKYICEKEKDCHGDPKFKHQANKKTLQSCYHFSKEKLSWNAANDKCSQMASHLVAIESATEQRFLQKIMEKTNFNREEYWTGGNFLSGKWMWQYPECDKPVEGDFKSVGGGEQIRVLEFDNNSDRKITLYWLSFDGKYVSYGDIKSGQQMGMITYVGHPWVALDKKDNVIRINNECVYFPQENEFEAMIV